MPHLVCLFSDILLELGLRLSYLRDPRDPEAHFVELTKLNVISQNGNCQQGMTGKRIFQECLLQDLKPALGSLISEYIIPKSKRISKTNPSRWGKQASHT